MAEMPEMAAKARAGEPTAERLGVVVPTLDEELLLPRLLARLAGGEGPLDRADRIVVSDGGSRDRTLELARAAGCQVVEGPRGRGAQLAAGARALDCELLLFLHADTCPLEGALAAVRAALAGPRVAATAMRQRIEARGALFRLIERAAHARSRLGLVYGDSGLAVRRAAYEAAGGFADLPLFEDLDLSRRLSRLGDVRLVPGATLLVSPRRWQSEGSLRATLRNWILTAGYLLGVPPERLARCYPARTRAGPHPRGQDAPTGVR